jgi:threonine dehydrogenase-like Zn-dependent dehydrogenase
MATMRGVVLPGEKKLEEREFPVPVPGHGQVLVRMRASGLCGSDLRAIYRPKDQGHGPEAYQGVIAGHEPCGVIEEVGPDVSRWKAGDRVALYHIAGCGSCKFCRAGWMINCVSPGRAAYGWQRDGGHADFLLAEARTLVLLPDALSFVDGALVACGFGTAYAALRRAEVSGRDNVLVTGLGPVGLGMAMLCRALGARVVGVESLPDRVELAKKLGVETVLAPGPQVLEAAMEASGGAGFEVCIDCSAAAPARRLCLEAAREWGRVVWVGEGGGVDFEPSPLLLHKQLSLFGSWVCSIGQMEELVELLARWNLHPEETVTHRFGLEQAREAYSLFDSGFSGKVVIEME